MQILSIESQLFSMAERILNISSLPNVGRRSHRSKGIFEALLSLLQYRNARPRRTHRVDQLSAGSEETMLFSLLKLAPNSSSTSCHLGAEDVKCRLKGKRGQEIRGLKS